MACSCGSKKSRTYYQHTAADGKVTVYSTEVEAKAAVVRRGGTYKPTK